MAKRGFHRGHGRCYCVPRRLTQKPSETTVRRLAEASTRGHVIRGAYIQSIARIVLYGFIYVFLEWLFFVTKPSVLSAEPMLGRIAALFVSAVPFLLLVVLLQLCLCLIAFSIDRLGRQQAIAHAVLRLGPALVFTCTALMLVDNFTYTAFGIGLVNARKYAMPVYWLFLAAVFIWLLRRKPAASRYRPWLAGGVCVISVATLFWSAISPGYAGASLRLHSDVNRPNIIFFASDGVSADHTSAYGYQRKTTPNLDKWLGRALIADNAFTNSGKTTGSLTSMMTGKYPATVKLFLPPQTLKGQAAYQHLPGILRRLGYKSLQETIRWWADSYELHWVESFDYANGRKLYWPLGSRLPKKLQMPVQFAAQTHSRLTERVDQLLLAKKMSNPYAEVTTSGEGDSLEITDEARMARVAEFIKQSKRPFLVHLHLMGTHCCNFVPATRHFSATYYPDITQRTAAAYDDTILQSDHYFGEMMDLLQSEHLLDNTIVVYTSDHDENWDFRSHVPLVILFPHGDHAGHVTSTTQLLDVAPTLLDYLGVGVSDWMEGKSLLRGHLPRDRPVFTAYQPKYPVDMNSPTFDLLVEGMVVCQHWYTMDLQNGNFASGDIPTYKDNCPVSMLPDEQQARKMMGKHLHERGFKF